MDTLAKAQAGLDSEESGGSDIWRLSGHAAILWLLGMALLASTAIGQTCSAIRLSESPQSLSWPVFVDQGQTLLAIDGAGQQVVTIGLHGGRAGAVEVTGFDEGRAFSSFSQFGDEIVQVRGDGPSLEVAWFNQDLGLVSRQPFDAEDVKETKSSRLRQSQRRLIAPYRWISTQGHLVGYGAVSSEVKGQDYELGFFDQPLPSQASTRIPPARLFHSFANPNFYLLGNPYIASLSGDIFYLEMGQYPALYRVDLGLDLPPEKIKGLPGENQALRDPMSDKLSLEQRADLMGQLDQFEGPWGLYQLDNKIYMLTRSLDGAAVDWRLHRLAIRDGRIDPGSTGVTVLPTGAQQIVLVPSPQDDAWLMFEQTVGSDGQRRLTTLQKCTFSDFGTH